MIMGEVPRLRLINELSKKDGDLLAKMIIIKGPNKEQADKMIELIFAEPKQKLDKLYKALDVQYKAVIKQAKLDCIIVGRISRNKVTKAGYDVCHHDGVGVYIRRNGERVSEIVNFDSQGI